MRAKHARQIRRGVKLARTSTAFLDQAVRECAAGDSYLVPHGERLVLLNLETAKHEGKLTEAAFRRNMIRGVDQVFRDNTRHLRQEWSV